MKYTHLNLVYFSATNTTKTIIESIASGISIDDITTYNITKEQSDEIYFKNSELVIFGFPVHSGRIPQTAAEYLNKFKGNNTPAIIVCIYGNRDYDDALLELRNLVSKNGFIAISAGAFIGQHSIFPKTGYHRPDNTDKDKATAFGAKSFNILEGISDIASVSSSVKVKGNFPYKEIKPIPLKPSGNRKCDNCGKCVRNCPTHAIDVKSPRKTNEQLCISCGRCIYICPQNARNFRGILYKLVSMKFNKAYSQRKEPEEFYI